MYCVYNMYIQNVYEYLNMKDFMEYTFTAIGIRYLSVFKYMRNIYIPYGKLNLINFHSIENNPLYFQLMQIRYKYYQNMP